MLVCGRNVARSACSRWSGSDPKVGACGDPAR